VKINKNDPQLTAYVLNELSAQQKKALESQIQNDPELKAEIARLKSNTSQLKNLKAQEAYRLDPHQRENIFKAAGINQTSIWSKILKYSGGLVAASLAVVIYVNNTSSLKKSASGAKIGLGARSELSEMSAAPVDAKSSSYETASGAAKKTAPAPIVEAEDAAAEMAADLQAEAPKPVQQEALAAAPKAKLYAAPAETINETQLAQNIAPSKDIEKKAAFAAGEVGAADMSQNKMRLLEPEQMRKKEIAAGQPATAAAVAHASPAAEEGFGSVANRGALGASAGAGAGVGAGAAAVNTQKPNVSMQLFDLESKSSQTDIYAKIADPVFKCFESSLSQYVQYDLAWNLTWSAKLGNVISFNSEMIDYGTDSLKRPRQNFSTEVSCAEQAIRQAFKTSLPPSQNENTFKYRLTLKSK
jgi:anti-sigma factor RsiW